MGQKEQKETEEQEENPKFGKDHGLQHIALPMLVREEKSKYIDTETCEF